MNNKLKNLNASFKINSFQQHDALISTSCTLRILVMASVLLSLFIIRNIINVNCVGLIVGTTCVPFDSISFHPDAYNQSHQIGWVKVMSCIESSTPNPFTFYRADYLSLTPRAISIKFQPSGGENNPNYTSLALIAKPYTNPIQYGLNYGHELSYIYNASGNVSGKASTSNWIGAKTALSRLNQGNCYGTYSGEYTLSEYRGKPQQGVRYALF